MTTAGRTRVPIRPGLFADPLDDLTTARLCGSQCAACREVSFALKSVCPNCGGSSIEPIPLGREGTLWTYTVTHHRPPGDYKGPEPFQPFGIGLIELPEGLRVISLLEGDPGSWKIGVSMALRVFVHHLDSQEREVIGYAFHPKS
jgi:uncharacterized OB-fold protein